MKPTERGKLVWKLGDILEAHADELAEMESLDNGKPIRDARAVDVPFGCELLRYMGGWSTKITGQSIPISAPGDWHAYSLREPVGVVGQIIPWNFPLLMAVWKIAPALATGCTIVLKPAEQTPLSAIRLGELIQEAGFPPGVVNIVTGDGTAGAAVAAHPDVDKVAFTSSTEVGKLIVQAAAGNLKKVSLELGSKSPAIVFPDADLSVAIPGAANGIFFNMGQCCTAGSRLFVHERIFDKMMTGLADEAAKLKIGPGLDPETRIGPLVSDEQFQRVSGYLDSGRKQGAANSTSVLTECAVKATRLGRAAARRARDARRSSSLAGPHRIGHEPEQAAPGRHPPRFRQACQRCRRGSPARAPADNSARARFRRR